jgi:hypothetical protein
VNHVLTGYNTVFSDGEMSIAAFEVAAGCGWSWVAWFLNISLMVVGIVVRPRLIYRGFMRGRRSGSIYHRTEDRATLARMTVGEVRTLVAIADR